MAAINNLIILSSSPMSACRCLATSKRQSTSPSDDLPSPSALVRKRNAELKSGSNIVHLPEGATTGFTSASTLFREAQPKSPSLSVRGSPPLESFVWKKTSIALKSTKDQKNPATVKAVKPRKTPAKRPLIEKNVQEAVPDTDVVEAEQSVSPHKGKATGKRKRAVKTPKDPGEKPKPRKRAARKIEVDTNSEDVNLPIADLAADKTKVTKKAAVRKKKTKIPKEPAPIVESCDAIKANEDLIKTNEAPIQDMTVSGPNQNIEQCLSAPLRRRSWTPVAFELPPSNQEIDLSTGEEMVERLPTTTFANLLDKFGHQQSTEDSLQPPKPLPRSAGKATRRKLVEGGEVAPKRKPAGVSKKKTKADTSKEPKPTKQPKQPKQPRLKNVTDHALLEYRERVELEDEGHKATPLDAYLQAASTQAVNLTYDVHTALEPEISKSGKRPTKDSRGRVIFKFPAPEKACSKLNDQAFLFGTSSQLAMEDSPTLIRQFQQAIAESEELEIMSQQVPSYETSPMTSRARVASAPHGTSLSVGQSVRNLWSVSARDTERKIFGEKVDSFMSHAPHSALGHASDTQPLVTKAGDHLDQSRPDIEMSHDASELDTKEDERQDSGFVDNTELEPGQTSQRIADCGAVLIVEDIKNPCADENRPERQVLQALDANASTTIPATKPKSKRATTKKVSKPTDKSPISGAKDNSMLLHGEPVKRARGRPRKDQTTDESLKSAPKPRVGTNKSKRTIEQPQTPRKTKQPAAPTSRASRSSSFKDIDELDEISDSEATTATPSPPRRLASSPAVSPLPLRLSPPKPSMGTEASTPVAPGNVEDSDVVPKVFANITRVIKHAPPSRNHSNPSWYEKMLMYDPIVLEDLTAWLNNQGVRNEITRPKQAERTKKGKAKKMQELELVGSTSHKGLKQAGSTEPVMETILEELKPHLVQRWCEHHSVCCLWKEGLRGGVRNRY